MDDTQEFKILDALVQNPEASVNDAVQQILRITLSEAASGEETNPLGNHPWATFTSLFDIIECTPAAHQSKLVRFLLELQKHTVTDPTTGKPVKHHGLIVWSELPSLGWAAADGYNFGYTRPGTTAGQITQWENRVAFAAQLTAATDVDYSTDLICPTDFSLHGLWTFRSAFEEDLATAPHETTLRSACLWYIYAADRLWANAENSRVFGGPEARKKDPSSGYNREIWSVWKDRLIALQTAYEDEGTRKLIQDAISNILRAEGSA